jgi:hypothetical protein
MVVKPVVQEAARKINRNAFQRCPYCKRKGKGKTTPRTENSGRNKNLQKEQQQ